MMTRARPRIAIVGATGAVGKEILSLMDSRGFPYSYLDLVASARSAGKRIEYRGETYEVQDLETYSFQGIDIAFFSAGTSTSREHAKRAADAGALVIDNTNAFRMDPLSPLVVPQVNAGELLRRPASGIVANPNCSTIQMVRALAPLQRKYGLKKVVVSTYQAASGGGLTGMEELTEDALSVLGSGSASTAKRFPRPLGFNVIPQVDVFSEGGFTLEEKKMVQESRKILDLPKLDLTATAVRVPVLNGHSEAVYVETEEAMDLDEVLRLLSAEEDLKVYADEDYPTPRLLNERECVHVGRIRLHPENPRGIWLWVVADNLWVGAALNAVQIAERILGQSTIAFATI